MKMNFSQIFTSIHSYIHSYRNIPNEIDKIQLLMDNNTTIKANFEFKQENLYASFCLNEELPITTKLKAKFGQYFSNNAFIVEIKPQMSEDKLIYEYKIILNDISFSHQKSSPKYNIAVLKKHKNMHLLDNIIANSLTNIAFNFCGKNFHIYIDNSLLVILCETQMKADDFLEYINSIKMALDFLNTELSGEIMYIFSANLENFAVNHYKIILLAPNTRLNFNIFIAMNYPIQEALGEALNGENIKIRLSKEEFERLCTLIHSNTQFKTSIHYILESSKAALECVLIYLSVALESNAKYAKGEECLMPKDKFKKFKKQIDCFIDNAKELNENEKSIFKNKIINQIPNSLSLKRPFEQVNMTLTDEELNILKKRNAILHATAIEHSSDIMQDALKYQKEARILYLMLYEFILKTIGYKGYIININKWDEVVEFINSYNDKTSNAIFKKDFVKCLK